MSKYIFILTIFHLSYGEAKVDKLGILFQVSCTTGVISGVSDLPGKVDGTALTRKLSGLCEKTAKHHSKVGELRSTSEAIANGCAYGVMIAHSHSADKGLGENVVMKSSRACVDLVLDESKRDRDVATVKAPGGRYKENLPNKPLSRNLPISCEASHYVWGGNFFDKKEKYTSELMKKVNSSTLNNVISLKSNKLMMDNDEFKIIKQSSREIFGVYNDEKNLISVALNFDAGSILYTKNFVDEQSKQHKVMSYVGKCINK